MLSGAKVRPCDVTGSLYSKDRFAKMIGLPDELIQTPD
jgi:hypothetical protein